MYLPIFIAHVVCTMWRLFLITQYIKDTHNVRTLIPMNIRTQTLPLPTLRSIFED
jgi:hypothetical protein